MPLIYYFAGYEITLAGNILLLLIMLFIDYGRVYIPSVKRLYMHYIGPVLRHHEKESDKVIFSGGTFIVLASLLCIILFPQPVAITAVLVIIYSDTAAAVIGKNFGKIKIGSKTVEGSAAFLVTALILVTVTPKVTYTKEEYIAGYIAAFFTTIFEALPLRIDDNISIPLFFGGMYLLFMKVLGVM